MLLDRTGDSSVMDPSHASVDPGTVNCFVNCALQIEDHWLVGNLTVVWYVLSDSIYARRKIQAMQGAKVLTRTDMRLEHTASGVDPDVVAGDKATAEGFRAALWSDHVHLCMQCSMLFPYPSS